MCRQMNEYYLRLYSTSEDENVATHNPGNVCNIACNSMDVV